MGLAAATTRSATSCSSCARLQLPETLARLLRLVCAGASDLTSSDFHLRHGRSAVVSFCARHGSGQQLFRAERCDDHEFVRVEGSRPGDHGSSAMAMVRTSMITGSSRRLYNVSASIHFTLLQTAHTTEWWSSWQSVHMRTAFTAAPPVHSVKCLPSRARQLAPAPQIATKAATPVLL